MDQRVTVVLTSCGRAELLKKTIESFLQFNTYPIKEWIITEDSGVPMTELMEKYPDFTWIVKPHRGQMACIDDAYSRVTTPYIFHMEDDWETYAPGVIEASFEVMSDKVTAVMCREWDDRVYKMSNNPPFLDCWGGWGYYSFNPGLRRTSDFQTIFKGSFSGFTGTDGLAAERAINDQCRELGYKMALTKNPAGFLRHIGDNRHVEEPVKKDIRIGLNMIVKDEAHVIEEVLTMTLPLIDTYCIVDTGSTDDTVKKIKDFYKKHAIEGNVYSRKWVDFGHNRSEALKLCDGKMDYILVIDADDIITFPPNGREILKDIMRTQNPSSMTFMFHQKECFYRRAQIFKANDGWKYKGVLHEYATNDKTPKEFPLSEDFIMSCRHLGARNTADKVKRDISVLRKALEKEPDNERYVFYLAQTYLDDQNFPDAIKWYKKRYEMGRWREEMYVSALWISRLTKSKEWAWKAHECNPERNESLVSYLINCREKGEWTRENLAMAMYAASIPKPTSQVLFFEPEMYDWRALDELSIMAFYCGRRDIAKDATLRLLNEGKLPDSQRPRIEANLRFN